MKHIKLNRKSSGSKDSSKKLPEISIVIIIGSIIIVLFMLSVPLMYFSDVKKVLAKEIRINETIDRLNLSEDDLNSTIYKYFTPRDLIELNEEIEELCKYDYSYEQLLETYIFETYDDGVVVIFTPYLSFINDYRILYKSFDDSSALFDNINYTFTKEMLESYINDDDIYLLWHKYTNNSYNDSDIDSIKLMFTSENVEGKINMQYDITEVYSEKRMNKYDTVVHSNMSGYHLIYNESFHLGIKFEDKFFMSEEINMKYLK